MSDAWFQRRGDTGRVRALSRPAGMALFVATTAVV